MGLPNNEMIRVASNGATDTEAFWIKMLTHFGLKVKDIARTMSLPNIGSVDISFKQDGSLRVDDFLPSVRGNGIFSVLVQSAPLEHSPDRWVAYVWGVDGEARWVLWRFAFHDQRPVGKGHVKEYTSCEIGPSNPDPTEFLSRLPTDHYSKYVLIWNAINQALTSLLESRKVALESACGHAEDLSLLDKIILARTSGSG